MNTTMGQQRAAYCLEMLKNLACSRADFKALSAGLPSMILQNGFGQTLAFLLAKGKDKHLAAFEITALWLVNRKLIDHSNHQIDILTQISKMPQTQYLQAQRETLAMLEWLKRYANAALFEGGI
ncbi:MAG: type III-B CRISPR module-associated protein Cmr5 [Chlorobium sp.]|jgi:CRISPR-associated protein Cmr5|nr:type III-B CRISPR module-associated protein Cmr5 [Chlorobium sp.]